jgi:hypothetical protein
MRCIILTAGLALACSGCAYGPDYYTGYSGYPAYSGYPVYSGYPAYPPYAYGYPGYGYVPYWGPSVGIGIVGGGDHDYYRHYGDYWRYGDEHRFDQRRFDEGGRGQGFWQHGEGRAAVAVPNAAPPVPRVAAPVPQVAARPPYVPERESRSGPER